MEKFKELAKNKFVLILVAVIAYFVVKELKTSYSLNSGYREGASEISKKFDDISAKTKEGESVTENVQKEFSELAKQQVDKQTSESEKAFAAANIVWGAYVINVRGRYDYCKKYGVDLTEFENLYKKRNDKIYLDVLKIQKADFKANNMTYNENDLYANLKDAQAKMLNQNMEELSKTWNVDMKLTCTNFNLSADKIIDFLDLNKTVPSYVEIVTNYASKIK